MDSIHYNVYFILYCIKLNLNQYLNKQYAFNVKIAMNTKIKIIMFNYIVPTYWL